MPLPTPPQDLSGGILTIGYTDGADEHFLGVHVRPFVTTVPSGPNYDWGYSAGTGFSETGVRDTAIALIDVIKPLYDNAWNFWVQALHRNSGGELVPVFPLPDVGAEVGTSSTYHVTLSDAARICASVYDAGTGVPAGGTRPGHFRIMLVGAGNRVLQVPAVCNASAGGIDTTNDPAIVAYLTGAASAIVGHNGTKPTGLFKIVVTERERLRRKYGFV